MHNVVVTCWQLNYCKTVVKTIINTVEILQIWHLFNHTVDIDFMLPDRESKGCVVDVTVTF